MKTKNLLFILLLSLFGWQIKAQNLVIDPSFELASPLWQMHTAGGRSIVNTGAEDGTFCEQITLALFPRSVWQNITVKPKNLYTVTGWMKSDVINTNAHIVVLWYFVANPPNNQQPAGYIKGDTVGVLTGTNPWTRDSVTLISPNNALSCQLFLEGVMSPTSSGTAWYDNFNFYNSTAKSIISTKDTTTFCQGLGATLVADTATGYTYKWLLNNIPIPGATSPTYYATSAGLYRLIVTYMTASDTSKPITINVNAIPLRNLSTGDPTTFCQGKSALLTADSLYGYVYKWLKNGTIMPGKFRRILNVTDSGTYKVIVTNQFCTDTTNSISIIVNPMTISHISTKDSTTFCQGRNALLKADSFPGYTFKWMKNKGLLSGKTTTLLDVITSGDYKVVVSNGLCPDTSNIITITVNTLPVTHISTTDNTTFCPGSSALLKADSFYGYTFKWLRDSVIIPGKLRKTITIYDSGDYKAIVTNEFCTDTSNDIIILLHPLPSRNITSLDPIILCPGKSATLQVDSFNGYSFKWLYFGSLIPGKTTSSLYVSSAGDYSAVISNSFCTDTTHVLTLTPGIKPPKPVVTLIAGRLFSNAKTGNQWYNNLGPIGGATDTSYKPTTNSTYFVIVTNSQGCVSDTSNRVLIKSFGISEEIFETYLKLYPNPSNGRFDVENSYYEPVKTEILDITGKVISEFIVPATETLSFSEKGLNTGIYLIRFSFVGNNVVKRLIIY